jgi:hypothetical protein
VIAAPDSRLCNAAAAYARRASEPSLFNHAMRTYVFGTLVGEHRGLRFDRELFYIAAILHDLGLTDQATASTRFELEGADAAKELLAREGMPDAEIEVVWEAIALHTTLGVPPRKRAEIALVQAGAAIDVGFAPLDAVAEVLPLVLDAWPRLGFKAALVGYLERLYAKNPAGALQSPVVADVIERRHGVRPPNVCDVIERAAFPE